MPESVAEWPTLYKVAHVRIPLAISHVGSRFAMGLAMGLAIDKMNAAHHASAALRPQPPRLLVPLMLLEHPLEPPSPPSSGASRPCISDCARVGLRLLLGQPVAGTVPPLPPPPPPPVSSLSLCSVFFKTGVSLVPAVGLRSGLKWVGNLEGGADAGEPRHDEDPKAACWLSISSKLSKFRSTPPQPPTPQRAKSRCHPLRRSDSLRLQQQD